MANIWNIGPYGTFTGPGGKYTFDDSEPNWWKNVGYDVEFTLSDVSCVLYNTLDDYALMRLDGTNTSKVTIERSSGPLTLFNVQSGVSVFSGEVYSNAGGHRLSAKKNFDIPHPNKPGWRLRHTCLEGPENAVYFRGKLKDSTVINLPDYWKDFVDSESITVHLTQVGSQQDLILDRIEDNKIFIKSGSGCSINCHYIVHGNRTDGEDLIVEYEGETPADYPGNNDEYSVVGWNYDVRPNKKES